MCFWVHQNYELANIYLNISYGFSKNCYNFILFRGWKLFISNRPIFPEKVALCTLFIEKSYLQATVFKYNFLINKNNVLNQNYY